MEKKVTFKKKYFMYVFIVKLKLDLVCPIVYEETSSLGGGGNLFHLI